MDRNIGIVMTRKRKGSCTNRKSGTVTIKPFRNEVIRYVFFVVAHSFKIRLQEFLI